jgi:short-subunit dehydrogenase
METVAGKRVLVTGAAMGLGRLFAERAVSEGAAAVVLWDLNETALKETVAQLEAVGGSVHPFVVDISSGEAIADAAARVRETVGNIDVLINNAGIVRGNNYFWEITDRRDIVSTLAVNSVAPMLITLEFLPAMVGSGTESRIVNIASMAGIVTTPRAATYVGSKWAAVGWSDSVRLDLAQAGHDHVKVTTVCPGYIDTGMFEGVTSALLTPILKPADVVEAAWKGMHKGEAFVILPWTSHIGRALGGVLPTRLRDFVFDRIGLHKSMAGFKGH